MSHATIISGSTHRSVKVFIVNTSLQLFEGRTIPLLIMMTSWSLVDSPNGSQKCEALLFFLFSQPEHAVGQRVELLVIWNAMIIMWYQWDSLDHILYFVHYFHQHFLCIHNKWRWYMMPSFQCTPSVISLDNIKPILMPFHHSHLNIGNNQVTQYLTQRYVPKMLT